MAGREPRTVEQAALGFRAWAGRTGGMRHAHRHSDLELNYVRNGRMRYLIGGRLVTLPVRRLCVLWGSLPHQSTESRANPEMIWVTAPLAWVLALDLPEPLIERLLTEGLAVDPVERAGDEAMLQQWINDLERLARAGTAADCPEPEAHRVMRSELEARLRRLASDMADPRAGAINPPEQPARAAGGRTLAAVQRIAAYINEHYQAPLTVDQIAEAARLNPQYAMTVFRQHLGLTLNQYLTRQRIAHAQRLLLTSRHSVLEIGLHSGFGSNSRFHEAFKQATGVSPARFRRQARPPR